MDKFSIAHLFRYKYEFFLFGLLQHLFTGVFITDMTAYSETIWVINMIILGLSSILLFVGQNKRTIYIRLILLILVIAFPLMYPFSSIPVRHYMLITSLIYTAFFGSLFVSVLKFLISPGKITINVIAASACGFFLILEIFVFGTQAYFYQNPACLTNIHIQTIANVFVDLVYFCSATLTTIGYGDITPRTHNLRLFVILVTIFSSFYQVVLVGVIISKFANVVKFEKK